MTTSIEWTDRTWNPVRGCSRVSEGCRNCYAERIAARFSLPGDTFHGFAEWTPEGPRWTGAVALLRDKLGEPLTWRKPARVFVNSMSDLFHEDLPDDAIDQVFAVMALARQHTFQILTKRAERMRAYMSGEHLYQRIHEAIKHRMGFDHPKRPAINRQDLPLPNVWLGVSVENQARADERIPLLLQTPAAVRFISAEPLLGPVDLTNIPVRIWRQWPTGESEQVRINALESIEHFVTEGSIEWPALNWVIVGGESGPGARPFDVAWARSIVEPCKSAGVACFVKQFGANARSVVESDGLYARGGCLGGHEDPGQLRFVDTKGGDPAEWPEDLRVRQFPERRAEVKA